MSHDLDKYFYRTNILIIFVNPKVSSSKMAKAAAVCPGRAGFCLFDLGLSCML